MPRKSASDSIAGRIEAARNERETWEVPAGFEPLNDAEQMYWDAFTQSRKTWNSCSLAMLHRLVKMQVRFLELEQECFETPRTHILASGSEAEHPIHRIRRDELKILHAQYRLCGLQAPYPRSSTVKADEPSGRGNRGAPWLLK